MEKGAERATLLWYGLLVWFAANLLSQSLYMGTYGVPYDAETVIRALGPYYIPILGVDWRWRLAAPLHPASPSWVRTRRRRRGARGGLKVRLEW